MHQPNLYAHTVLKDASQNMVSIRLLGAKATSSVADVQAVSEAGQACMLLVFVQLILDSKAVITPGIGTWLHSVAEAAASDPDDSKNTAEYQLCQ